MKNTENIYELLNYLSIDLEDYAKEELSDMEKQKLKRAFRRKKNRSNSKKIGTIAVALLAVVIFAQTGWGKAVYAATESKLAEISYSISEALGIERNIAPYANVVNQVVESNSTAMKLTDVIIDKDELILSIITSTNKPVQEGIDFDYGIFINGKKIRNYGGSGSSGSIDDSQTRFFSVRSVNIDGIDTTGNVDIKVVLKNLTHYFTGDNVWEKVKGKWEFEFVANGSELMADTHALALDYGFHIGDEKYTLEEFRYNPVNQKIFGKVKDRSEPYYKIDLRGRDNLGNEVEFRLTRVSGEDLIFKYQNLHGDLSKEITSITLTPYAAKLPEKSGKISDVWEQVGEAFTIHLDQ